MTTSPVTTQAAEPTTGEPTNTEPTTFEAAEAITDAYLDLRERCYEAARRDNGALMGGDAWLRNALSEYDMTCRATPDGISCTGSTYTSQTMSREWFDFTIPYAVLTGKQADQ